MIPYSKVSCMKWTWYIAVDIHLFMMSPIILYSFYRSKLLGYCCCFVLLIMSFVYIGVYSFVYHFSPSYLIGWSNEFQMTTVYNKPWARIGSFLLGITLGSIYRGHIERNKKIGKDLLKTEGNFKADIEENIGIADKFEILCVKMTENTLIRYFGYFLGFVLMAGSNFYVYEIDKYGENY